MLRSCLNFNVINVQRFHNKHGFIRIRCSACHGSMSRTPRREQGNNCCLRYGQWYDLVPGRELLGWIAHEWVKYNCHHSLSYSSVASGSSKVIVRTHSNWCHYICPFFSATIFVPTCHFPWRYKLYEAHCMFKLWIYKEKKAPLYHLW